MTAPRIREPLSAVELARLENAAVFIASFGETGWSLAGRLVADMELHGLPLEHARWQETDFHGVTFRNVDWREANILNVLFASCVFVGCKFSETMFDHCEFRNSMFDRCTFKGVRFTQCILTSTALSRTTFSNVMFLRCTIAQVRQTDVDLHSVTFEDNDITKWTAEGGSWDVISMTGGSLQLLRLMETTIGSLELSGVAIGGVELSLTPIDRLLLRQVTGNRILLESARCGEVTIVALEAFEELSAAGTIFRRLALVQCPDLSQLNLLRCEIHALAIEQSLLRASGFEQCTVGPLASIRGSILDRFSLIGSFVTGMSLEDTTISRWLTITDTEFSGLKLTSVRWERGAELRSTSVRYLSSDSFDELSRE